MIDFKHFLKLLFILFLFPVGVLADVATLTVLQTTDTHSYSYKRDQNGNAAGWLKLATVIRREKAEAAKRGGCLLIDCGDTVQGDMLGVVSKGEAAVAFLNRLNYDVWVIGNHEFDFGLGNLRRLLKQCRPVPLAANLSVTPALPNVKPWVMVEKNGIKAAVIGMTHPKLEKWFWGKRLDGVKVCSFEQALERTIPEVMRAQPDIIILAVHYGDYPVRGEDGSSLKRIADKYPQIDLILGGHTHTPEPGRRLGRNSWYVQAGKHGKSFAKITINVDLAAHRVVRINSLLITPGDVADDRALYNRLQPWLKRCRSYKSAVVGSAKYPINPLKEGELNGTINDLFSTAMAEATGAKFAFHSSVRPNLTLTGEITEADLFRLMPYEDTVGTLMLTQLELKAVIEEQVRQIRLNRFQSPWGLVANLSRDGAVNGSLKFNHGTALKPGKRYKTAFSSYVLAGASNRFPILKALALKPATQPADSGIPIRTALKRYIKTHSPLTIKKVQWLKR